MKPNASASSATAPLPGTDTRAAARAPPRLKRRPPSSIIDGPTHWDVGPWWNWQHVWLWTRRFQVRVLAGQSAWQHPAEGWPSGLRRRPAKALTRKSLVGSNPTPSAYLPPASPRRLPDGWPSGLRRTPGERVGSNPASWVRIPPRPLKQFPRGSMNMPARRGFEPSERRSELGEPRSDPIPPRPLKQFPRGSRTERAKRARRGVGEPTERPQGASSATAGSPSHPVRIAFSHEAGRKFDSGSPLGAPSPAAPTGRLGSSAAPR